ncbi:PKD domain-containing protein, partial [Methanococcoides sp. AM1]|uniref:PKD domain-containing protein n=1 Tax=Methanococcoides sp. AM1 TaxID=1201011 RepID=UPI001083D362
NLTVSNINGTASEVKTGYINVTSVPILPVSDFSANVTEGIAPLSIAFTDLSTNATSWSWDIDADGTEDYSSQNIIHTYDTAGLYTVNLTVSNINGTASEVKTGYINVTPSNQPPVADANGPYMGDEGSPITFNASNSTDPNGDTLTFEWDFNYDGVNFDVNATGQSPTNIWYDNATFTVAVRVSDDMFSDIDSTTVTVNNVAPNITSLAVLETEPVEVGTKVNLTAEFLDPGIEDTHNYTIDWGDNTEDEIDIIIPPGDRVVDANHTYATSGLYNVTFIVEDDDGGSDTDFRYVLVYDSTSGSVACRGSFDSPAGAYVADPGLTGVATFDFTSKYKKGVLIGKTQFEFEDLNFHSVDYEWMVVAGHKAIYKGNGTVNGEGNYEFLISVIDAGRTPDYDTDMLRIKIWDKDNNNVIVYDNMSGEDDVADPITPILKGRVQIRP